MNNTKNLLLACLLLPALSFAQGSSCGSPYTIPLDGLSHTFAASSNTAGAVVCTNTPYSGNSPVTWFSFTTNALGEMPLLDITAADSSSCEIAMYTACNGGGILQTLSSMCFDDGWGLWSPAQNFALLPNTTYHLRIKTQTATQINIIGQSYTPSNNTCSGATPVDATTFHDNNACNKPSSEVTPGQLCAFTLENTAFYQFYIASQGAAIINISSIACDNGNNNNDNGIQIGFFTGSCGALTPLNCYAGTGPYVQATTPILNAGTKVYVAIDGNAGSNCQYDFQAVNAFKVLAGDEFKNFSGWKNKSSNIIKWTGAHNINSYFQIERSGNGSDFSSLGKVYSGSEMKEINYQYEDRSPLLHAYYRIKRFDQNGKIAMSNTIRVDRSESNGLKLVNPVKNELIFEIESGQSGSMQYSVMSMEGKIFLNGTMQVVEGLNKYHKDLSQLPGGQYIISVTTKQNTYNSRFIKAD